METNRTYYLTNKSVEPEILFRTDENCNYFYSSLIKYVSPIAEIHSCVLQNNSYHLLVTIKDLDHIKQCHRQNRRKPFLSTRVIRQQFSNLMNSYAQSFNRYYSRKGTLFQKGLVVEEIPSEEDLYLFHDALTCLPDLKFYKFITS